MNKKIIFLSLLIFIIATPVFAKINVGDEILEGELDAQKALETGKEVLDEAKNLSDKAVQTLEEKAGIDLIGILKTIGTWFVFFIELMLKALKWVLAKI